MKNKEIQKWEDEGGIPADDSNFDNNIPAASNTDLKNVKIHDYEIWSNEQGSPTIANVAVTTTDTVTKTLEQIEKDLKEGRAFYTETKDNVVQLEFDLDEELFGYYGC